MNIIIIGGGKVGFALASSLSNKEHNISVIDINEDVLDKFSEMLDVFCVNGSGSNVEVLNEAGIENADLVISVTGNDELNIVVSIIASKLKIKNTVARIRNPEYAGEIELLKSGLGIKYVINPEFEAAIEISRILALPAVNKVDTFGNGRVEIAEYTVLKTDLIVGKALKNMQLPSNILICGIERNGEFAIPSGNSIIEAFDILYMSGTIISMNNFFKAIGNTIHKARNIMVIGGSRMAFYLAKIARKMGINIKIIEIKRKRCEELSKHLDECLIICGDGTEEELLLSEDLKKMDAFIALTDNDEENMLSCYYAKKQGVKKVIPKINRRNYIDMVKELGFDSIVCPRSIITEQVVRYVQVLENRKSAAMQKLYNIANGKAEAAEFIASKGNKVLDRKLEDIKLKKDVLIAAIIHGKEVIIPCGRDVIRAGDQVLVFSKKVIFNELDDILDNLK